MSTRSSGSAPHDPASWALRQQALEESLARAREAYAEVRRRLLHAADVHADVVRERDELLRQLELVQMEAREAKAHAAHFSSELAQLNQTLATVFSSRSWRWTRPLRRDKDRAASPKAILAQTDDSDGRGTT